MWSCHILRNEIKLMQSIFPVTKHLPNKETRDIMFQQKGQGRVKTIRYNIHK